MKDFDIYLIRDVVSALYQISCELMSRYGYPQDVYYNEEYVYKFRDAYIKAIQENKVVVLPDFVDASKEQSKALLEYLYDTAAQFAYNRPCILDGDNYYGYHYFEPDIVEDLTNDSIYAMTQKMNISRKLYVKIAKEFEADANTLEEFMLGDIEYCDNTTQYFEERLEQMYKANKYQIEHGLELDYSEYAIQSMQNKIYKLENDKQKINHYLDEVEKIVEDSKKLTLTEKIKGFLSRKKANKEQNKENEFEDEEHCLK